MPNQDSKTIRHRRVTRIMAPAFLALIGAITAVSLYNFWRIDRVQENVEAVNQFYVPVLKHLNLINGKWSAYQRSFEQYVAFRKWGETGTPDRAPSKLPLRKMIEPNIVELSNRLERVSRSKAPESAELRSWIKRVTEFVDQEQSMMAEIASLIKTRHFAEAAAIYTRARQEQLEIAQGLVEISRDAESRLSMLQLSTEQELRDSQNVMLLLLVVSLFCSLIMLFRLRRWFMPVVEWTRVASEIAAKGITRDVKFPQITRGMPPEISLLTREFTRMGMTVLERERTIHQQKDKLESLNVHLKEQNERLRKLGGLNERVLNSMSSGLLVINSHGVVEQFNEKYCELFNADRNLILTQDVRQVLESWPQKLPSNILDELLTTNDNLRIPRLSLGARVFDLHVSHLGSQAGRLLLFEDITHLVEAEEKLAHARKLVLAGNMSSQVAHEVRNPLNSMSLQLEMLDEDLTEAKVDGSARERIRAIDEQVQRLERMTRRYLDVQRPALRRRDSVDLHNVIERSITFLSHEFQAAQVRVELSLKAEQRVVTGDADALSQVIFNLVRNALEAVAESKERVLHIATANRRNEVIVEVSDSGPGIDASIRGRIFEPFVTNKASGHGVGLSLSRQICIEHGGELKLLDTASGAGASFEFMIPLFATTKENISAPDLNS